MDTATEEKLRIEDKQRQNARQRETQGTYFRSRFFKLNTANEYEFSLAKRYTLLHEV